MIVTALWWKLISFIFTVFFVCKEAMAYFHSEAVDTAWALVPTGYMPVVCLKMVEIVETILQQYF